MPTLFSLLILAAVAAAPTGTPASAPNVASSAVAPSTERYPDAVEVFHCNFGPAWDSNFDHWPDRWTRLRSANYPPYLPIQIVDETAPDKGHSLSVGLDGGAVALFGPQFKVAPLFSYVIEASIKTQGLRGDSAHVSVTFFDAKKKPVATFVSEKIGETTPWTKVRIGPIAAPGDTADYAVIGLHLEPTGRPDLHGQANFAEVWAGQLPRLTLSTNSHDNVYVEPNLPKITCAVAGLAIENPRIAFELLDMSGRVIAEHEQRLTAVERNPPGQNVNGQTKPSSVAPARTVAAGTGKHRPAPGNSSRAEIVTWSPPISAPGFYRLRVEIPGRVGVVHRRELSLAVISPERRPASGEFGWTLPSGEGPLSFSDLAELIGQSGINWVKFPVWTSQQDGGRNDRIMWLSERLHLQQVELVGLLHLPPPEVLSKLGDADHPLAAQVFSAEPELWYPSLEPTLTSLSLKLRWWQLGLDKDVSFVGYPKGPETIARVRKFISRFGQQVNLGIGWSWLNELPREQQAWDFVSLSADPPLTWKEQSDYLAATANCKTKRWVVVEPLPRDDYSAETRAADLARRMMAAKMQGAEGIFVPAVFSTERGLMNDDGTAGDLLLPWRTMALALAGKQYLGSINLLGGSVNHVFGLGEEIVMVVWNDRPTQERVLLGGNVRQLDLWGRSTLIPTTYGEQMLEVGPMPTLVTGLNGSLFRLRTSIHLQQTTYPSVFGTPHPNVLTLKNSFAQGISGHVRLATPAGWRTVPRDFNFKLAAGESLNQPFEVTLPLDAVTGKQDLRLDFDLMADQRYEFNVHRSVDVGSDDIYVKVATRLNEHGELEIEQRLVNETDTVASFKCYLYLPERLPVVSQVVEQGRGTDTKTFQLPKGQELVGKTLLLRADEIGGQRIINYRFVAQP
jgi:hypothetical protein